MITPYIMNKIENYNSERMKLKSSLPSNLFKKNSSVNFKYKKKILTGNITKLGEYGVDVKCNGKFYYCSDFNDKENIFDKSNKTKNYT